MKQLNCDLCENHCPVDALKCGKGRRHFGTEPEENGHGTGMPGGALGLLMECGHFLHHGGGDLSALSEREQTELERLLTVLLADWKSRRSAEMPERRHGRHGE